MRDETLAVHAGYETDPTTKSVVPPIYQTVAYEFDDAQHGADLFNLEVAGNIYTRIMNPTADVLEKRIAEMEGGIAGLALSAGSAAINYAILTIAKAGANIVSVPMLYGGTYTLFAHMLPGQGIDVRFAEDDSAAALEKLIDDKTAAVFFESIGNPAGNIVDIEAIAKMAHSHGVPVIVDATVSTPVLTKSIEWGADIVVHSMTKYIGGHGNSLGGVIVDSGKFPWADHPDRFPMLIEPEPAYHGVIYTETFGPAAFIARARTVPLRNTGSAISPLNAFLILQGIETLPMRMERHVRERAGRGRTPQGPRPGGVGQLRRSARLALLRAGAEVHRRQALGPAELRRQGRLRARHQVLRRTQALQAAGQHRRRQFAGSAPRVDDASADDTRGAGVRRRHARNDPPVRRHRAHRRHPRRPRPGPGCRRLAPADTTTPDRGLLEEGRGPRIPPRWDITPTLSGGVATAAMSDLRG